MWLKLSITTSWVGAKLFPKGKCAMLLHKIAATTLAGSQ